MIPPNWGPLPRSPQFKGVPRPQNWGCPTYKHPNLGFPNTGPTPIQGLLPDFTPKLGPPHASQTGSSHISPPPEYPNPRVCPQIGTPFKYWCFPITLDIRATPSHHSPQNRAPSTKTPPFPPNLVFPPPKTPKFGVVTPTTQNPPIQGSPPPISPPKWGPAPPIPGFPRLAPHTPGVLPPLPPKFWSPPSPRSPQFKPPGFGVPTCSSPPAAAASAR